MMDDTQNPVPGMPTDDTAGDDMGGADEMPSGESPEAGADESADAGADEAAPAEVV